MRFSGAVLAGGRSERFGQDKARYVVAGKALAEHVLASLNGATERFLVASRPYPEFGLPVYPDLVTQQSPLSGVHTALRYAQCPWVAVAACDLPNLSPAYWTALASFCGEHDAVAVVRNGQVEPLAAFYHKSLFSRTEARLRRGDLALHALLASVNTCSVDWACLDLPEATLLNVNRLKDLRQP